MDFASFTPFPLSAVPPLVALATALLVVAWPLSYLVGRARYYYLVRNIPYVHDVGWFGRWTSDRARNEFIGDFKAVMQKGFAMNDNAFRVQTDFGEVIVLASRYAEEIRDDAGLSAGAYTNIELMGSIPGMEVFAFTGTHRALLHDVITKRLNRNLPELIPHVSNETTESLKDQWTDATEWHAVPLYATLLATVARVSVRVFLGKALARNPRWVELNSLYTTVGLGAVMALRQWPRFLLPVVQLFHPRVKETRAVLAEARGIMATVQQRRAAAGDKRDPNSLDWFDEVAAARRETFDPTVAQLTFGVASMHSTSDELAQVLVDLRDQPDVVDAMRRELVDVAGRKGWTYAALNQLKLMDSVLKETQRLKPINQVFNKRAVLRDLKLSQGIHLPRGAFCAISSASMRDPAVFDDPGAYDAYRFVKRAEESPEATRFCGFSSVSLQSTGFGFGKHACPGRTYVSLELKMLLAHIILKYEWRFPDGYEPKYMNNGFDSMTDITTEVLVKRREPEIALP